MVWFSVSIGITQGDKQKLSKQISYNSISWWHLLEQSFFSKLVDYQAIHKHWNKLHILDIHGKERRHSVIRHICFTHSFFLSCNPVSFPQVGKIHLFLLPYLKWSSKTLALETLAWNINDHLISQHINLTPLLIGQILAVR